MPWHAAQSIPLSPNAGVARVLPIQVTGVRCPVLSDFPTASQMVMKIMKCVSNASMMQMGSIKKNRATPRNSFLHWAGKNTATTAVQRCCTRLWVLSSSGISASAYRCRQRRPATWVQNAKSIAQTNVFLRSDGNTTTPPLAPLVLLVPALALALASPLPLHNTSDRTIPGIGSMARQTDILTQLYLQLTWTKDFQFSKASTEASFTSRRAELQVCTSSLHRKIRQNKWGILQNQVQLLKLPVCWLLALHLYKSVESCPPRAWTSFNLTTSAISATKILRSACLELSCSTRMGISHWPWQLP